MNRNTFDFEWVLQKEASLNRRKCLIYLTNSPFSYYKQILLKALFTIHINKDLLRIDLLLRKLSAELPTQFATQKSLLTVNSLAALSTIHGLRSRAIQGRKLSLLADVVEKFNRSLGSQALLPISQYNDAIEILRYEYCKVMERR